MNELCLVLNLGSSSLKTALVDPTGACPWQKSRSLQPSDELDWVLDSWLAPQLKPFREHIDLIAHRVVHGGEQFTAPTLIDRVVEKTLQKLIPLAPLHNPPALRGLAWSRGWAPAVPQWACFDTAFTAVCRPLPVAMRSRQSCAAGDFVASVSMGSTINTFRNPSRGNGANRGRIPRS